MEVKILDPSKKLWFETKMPASEACLHMRVYGCKLIGVLVKPRLSMVQLWEEKEDRCSVVSFPITMGEAGLYKNADKTFHYYED